MAERKPPKARAVPKSGALKRASTPARPPHKSLGNPLQAALERLEANVSGLKRERDLLSADLAAAKAHIAALESARADAANRIDWVLNSLQSVMLDKS